MKVRMLQTYNTPHRYIPEGTVLTLDKAEALSFIEAGIAEAVQAERSKAVRGQGRKTAVKK